MSFTRRNVLTGAAAAGLTFVGPTGVSISRASDPKRGGTLVSVIQPEPSNLVLALSITGPAQTVGGKIYQSLLRFDPKLRPLPGLAKSWDVSADGLTYTFKLQENVKWHDGTPFTAEDVVFSIGMLIETHPRARPVLQKIKSTTAPDPHTVVFTFEAPYSAFLGIFETSSCPIMPSHIYKGTDYQKNKMNETPIGTGPFKFKQWVKGSHIHLVRNENYWKQGKPYLDEIYYKVIPDAASRSVALETQEIFVSQWDAIDAFDIPRLKKLPFLNYTTKGYEIYAAVSFIEINHRRPPLNDKRFRQALLYALDRKFILENIWLNQGNVSTGPFNQKTKFFEPDTKKYDFDPSKAEALLDEMGLQRKVNGSRAQIELIVLPFGEQWVRLGEYIKEAMRKVGVDIKLKSTDVAGWTQSVSNWDYDMSLGYLFQWGDPELGIARQYISSNIRKVMFGNTMGYSNPKVDDLFARGASAVQPDERAQLYSEVQKILVDDVPVAWLLEMEFATFMNKKFQNAITGANGTQDYFDDAYVAT